MSSLEDASVVHGSVIRRDVSDYKKGTHAKEKLSTFWMAATAEPAIVMFVNGVL